MGPNDCHEVNKNELTGSMKAHEFGEFEVSALIALSPVN